MKEFIAIMKNSILCLYSEVALQSTPQGQESLFLSILILASGSQIYL